jgi:indole-3-glycerol phosphate synthase
MTILDEIFAHKRREVERQKEVEAPAVLRQRAEAAPVRPDFLAALRDAPFRPALIAEVKRASPSRGALAESIDPLALAETYVANGASAVSVLTDARYFQGSLADLAAVARNLPSLPLLRKDFIFDPYQVYQARLAGASAVLLIAAVLEPGLLADLQALIHEQGMLALVEVHDLIELELALSCSPRLLGINNRNLHDFSVDLETTFALKAQVPHTIPVVAESGIQRTGDVARMGLAGVQAILVGEALVCAPDVAAQTRVLAEAGKAQSSSGAAS